FTSLAQRFGFRTTLAPVETSSCQAHSSIMSRTANSIVFGLTGRSITLLRTERLLRVSSFMADTISNAVCGTTLPSRDSLRLTCEYHTAYRCQIVKGVVLKLPC